MPRRSHDKLRALVALPDIELTLLAPAAWRTAFGVSWLEAGAAPYRVIAARVILNGRIGAYLYLDGLRELRRAWPDVVHIEVEPWSLAALQCVIAARGMPVVLFTRENLDGPRRLLARVIERIVLRRIAFVIAGNQGARARLARRGVPTDRIDVLPQFGVDPVRYAAGDGGRVRGRFALRSPVVGYVGRLVPEKGVDVLIDAMEQLFHASLLVVGDGPARRELERRVAHSATGQEAHFTGAVPHDEIPDYLACLEVLVLPSRGTPSWTEQFGHVLVEAMAAGVPVVGSSAGAIPEVIGDAGLIFPEGDIEALRCMLGMLLTDEALRTALVSRGYERLRARCTHTVIALAQRDIYARLLAG